ncbi:MAG: hypothetical protein LUQ55_04700 [Methanomassiliicoccales archaeon]|nr:hypothetical protein [Methanomassiliicoccales archaeon]
MATLNEQDREVIEEALSQTRKTMTFEQTLGKTMRKRDMDFDSYVRLMGEIRDLARKRKISVEEAAESLVKGLE